MKYRLGISALAVGLTALSFGLGAPAAQAAPANVTLATFAGYGLATAPASATASMSFKVPTISCTSTNSAVAIGAGVVTGSGTTAKVSGAAVVVGCTSGKAGYEAVAEVKGVVTKLLAVSPGDSIVVSGSESSAKTSVSLADSTKKFSKTLSGTGAKPAQVADGMTAVPVKTGSTTLLPVPSFGKVSISAATIDGKTPKAAAALAVDMKSSKGILQISTGALSATGNAWTETFKHT